MVVPEHMHCPDCRLAFKCWLDSRILNAETSSQREGKAHPVTPGSKLHMVLQEDGCLYAKRHQSLRAILRLHFELEGRALGQGQIVM